MDVIALQEVRWPGNFSIRKGDSTILYSGTDNDRHERDVGFVVHDDIYRNVKHFDAINDRICYLHIKSRLFDVILLNWYAPTEEDDDDIKSTFYDRIEQIYDHLPSHAIIIVLGDFNAKIGKEIIYRPTIGKESLHEVSNDNGLWIINFANAKNLIVASTYFPRKNIHKQT